MMLGTNGRGALALRGFEDHTNAECKPPSARLVLLLLALIVGGTVCLCRRTESPGADANIYTGLAESLLRDGHYRFNFEDHTMYPPGLPLLLAGVGTLAGTGYPVRICLNGLFGFLGLAAAYFVLRRRAPAGLASVIVLILATAAYFVQYLTANTGSEMLYFATSMGTLWLADQTEPRRGGRRVLVSILLAACTVLTVLTRTIGAAMLPALVIGALRTDRRNRAVLATAAVAGTAALALWFWWAAAHKPALIPGEFSYSYFDHLRMKDFHDASAGQAGPGDLALRFRTHGQYAGAAFSEIALRLPYVTPWLWSPLVVLPMALVVATLAGGLRRRAWWDMADIYTVCYLTVALTWWFADDPQRFLFPIFPLLAWQAARAAGRVLRYAREHAAEAIRQAGWICTITFVISAVELVIEHGGRQQLAAVGVWLFSAAFFAVAARIPRQVAAVIAAAGAWRRCRPIAAAAAVVWVLGSFAWQAAQAAERMQAPGEAAMQFATIHAGHWVLANTRSDAIVMTSQWAILHKLTGRKTVAVPPTMNRRLLTNIFKRRAIAFLVVHEESGFRRPDAQAIFATLRAAGDVEFADVACGPGYRIYRVEAIRL